MKSHDDVATGELVGINELDNVVQRGASQTVVLARRPTRKHFPFGATRTSTKMPIARWPKFGSARLGTSAL